jgi:hypothetical protein
MTDALLLLNNAKQFKGEDILLSKSARNVISKYVDSIFISDKQTALLLKKTFGEGDEAKGLIGFFLRLLSEKYDLIKDEYMPLTKEKETVLNIIDGIYDIWRKEERYAEVNDDVSPLTASAFVALTDSLSEAVIRHYRIIYENVLGGEQTVYRQLPSGVNAGFKIGSAPMNLPADLQFLKATAGVKAILIRPPFICSTSENTRTGTFFEQDKRLQEQNYDPSQYRALCILIKGRVGYIYVHVRFLSFLVSLGNLFQIARFEDVKNEKPDFIVVFGADVPKDNGLLTYYYQDEGTYVGICPLNGHIDYFGYMKKIILTLHNLKMIDEGKLPIHGAGIEVTLKNGKTFNVVILGDSGAGKSETIEAVRSLGSSDIADITTIYDDMGTFQLRDKTVMTNGTETGAFVRLDDLSGGYSLRSIDRAIYINIDMVNSRVVIPIETYETSKELHKVDFFLLADNYTPDERGLVQFNDLKEAEAEFIKGQRMAKGTTSEKGLVSSFFANPFGPVQRQADCQKLIDMYFAKLFEEKVFVGKLYTKLFLDPEKGPVNGAKALIELLKKSD